MPFLISHETLLAYERPLCASSGIRQSVVMEKTGQWPMRLFSKKRSQSWMRLWLPHYVERSLDLGHQRVLSPGLSKLRQVFRHPLGPGFIVGEQIGLVRFVYGAGLCAPAEIP